jgi:hypothetical protein
MDSDFDLINFGFSSLVSVIKRNKNQVKMMGNNIAFITFSLLLLVSFFYKQRQSVGGRFEICLSEDDDFFTLTIEEDDKIW